MTLLRMSPGLGLIPASSRPAPTGAPVNTVAPSIAGVLTQGQTLTADPGVWANLPAPAYAYQWKRSGADIAGETGQTYVAAAADVSAGAGALSVEVTATNDVGSTVAASAGVTIAAPLAITWTPPAGQVGVAYSYLPTVTGGHGPYSFALSGTLPSGLSFDEATGEVSGTPLSTETASGLEVTVADADGLTAASGAKSIAVTSGGLVVAGTPVTTATVDAAYDTGLTGSGGTAPYTYEWVDPTKAPPGLKPSGTTYPSLQWAATGLRVKVTDADGATATSAAFDLTVGPNTVGGLVMDQPITSGFFDGYTPVFGDDFAAGARINHAAAPYERYVARRLYGRLPQSNNPRSVLDQVYYTDPYATGHRDRNRGVPVPGFANSLTASASVLSMYCGKLADPSDIKFLGGAGQQRFLASALLTGQAFSVNPGASGVWYVCKYRFPNTPLQSTHATHWVQSMDTYRAREATEVDFERNSTGAKLNGNNWDEVGKVHTTRGGSAKVQDQDGEWHEIAIHVGTTLPAVSVYENIAGTWTLFDSFGSAEDGNDYSNIAEFLITNTIWNSQDSTLFDGEGWDATARAAWDAGDGVVIEVDYWCALVPTGSTHIRPKASIAPRLVDCDGETHTVSIPAAADLWSTTPAKEVVQMIPYADVEPGSRWFSFDVPTAWSASTNYTSAGSLTARYTNDQIRIYKNINNTGNLNKDPLSEATFWQLVDTIYTRFPEGMDWDEESREFTLDTSKFRSAGRLLVSLNPDNGLGSSGEPILFPIYVGPRCTFPSNVTWANGQTLSLDLYDWFDCGILVTDAAGQRAKTVEADAGDLAALGLSFDPATYILSGTISASAGLKTLRFTVTNSVGQSATFDLAPTIGTPDTYETITNGLVAAYDASHVQLDTEGNLDYWLNKAAGHSPLKFSNRDAGEAKTGSGSWELVAGGLNGRDCLRINRDATNPVRAMALPGDPVSQVVQGTRKPFTVAYVLRFADSNTGSFGWSSAKGILAPTEAELVTLSRRSGSSGSSSWIARQNGSATNNASLGGAFLLRTAETNVIVITFDGTSGKLYFVNATDGVITRTCTFSTDVADISEQVRFMLGATEGASSVKPAYAGSNPNVDIGEVRVWDRVLTGDATTGEIGTLLSDTAGVGLRAKYAATTPNMLAANRLQIPSATTTLNNNLEYTSRREHYATTQGDISDLVFVDVNWTWALNAPANPGNPTKRKKWVEYPQGTILGQVTHSGGSTDWAEIPDGGQLAWDPFPATIPAGAKFWERTTEKNDSGVNRTQVCIELPDTPAHVGVDDGNSITVGIGATGDAIPVGSSHPRTIGSSLIVGTIAAVNARGVLMFGDSITLGVADTTGTSVQGGSGWGARTLDREGLPWAKGAIGGQDASAVVANYLGDSRFLAFVGAAGFSEVWVAYGTNDLRDSASVNAVMDSLAAIAAAFPGKTIHCPTVGPRSTSTDGYATVANQTVKTDGNWAGLTALNAAIRARPAWLNGQIIEFADAVMSARDSGLWAAPPAPTPDGTHPNTTCCTAVAAAIAFS